MMIHLNLLSGPDSTNLRLTQIRSCMLKHYEDFTATTSPGFSFYVGRIISELGDLLQPNDGETMAQAAWRYARDRAATRTPGQKCCKARYNAVVSDALASIPHWSLDLFETQHVCIEYDMVPRKALSKIPLAVDLVAPAAGAAPNSTGHKLGACDKALRISGANACVIDLQLLSDGSYHRIVVCLVYISRPSVSWSGECSRDTRNVISSQRWFKKQLDHGLVDTLYATLDVLLQDSFLRDAGFISDGDPDNGNFDICEIAFDDDLANLAGTAALVHFRNRMRRTNWMRGWPHQFTQGVGENDAVWSRLLARFQKDVTFDKALIDLEEPDKYSKDVHARSRMRLQSVEQLKLAAEEFHYQPHPEFTGLVNKRTLCCVGSNGVEQLNNHQKNSKQLRLWGGRYRRPQTSLAVTVRGKVLQKVHEYDAVESCPVLGPSDTPLCQEDFVANHEPTLPFYDVRGTSAKPPYFRQTPRTLAFQ